MKTFLAAAALAASTAPALAEYHHISRHGVWSVYLDDTPGEQICSMANKLERFPVTVLVAAHQSGALAFVYQDQSSVFSNALGHMWVDFWIDDRAYRWTAKFREVNSSTIAWDIESAEDERLFLNEFDAGSALFLDLDRDADYDVAFSLSGSSAAGSDWLVCLNSIFSADAEEMKG